MKIAKIVGISLVVLLGIFLLLGLWAPHEVYTSQSIDLPVDPATAFNVVNDLRTWDKWSSWKESDPSIQMVLSDTFAGAGANYSWTSNESGAGTLRIVGAWPTDSLRTEMEFSGMGLATSLWTFVPNPAGGVRVSWDFHTRFPYPINGMLWFQDFKSAIDKDFARGLVLLRDFLAQSPDFHIHEIDFPGHHYLADRQVVAMDQIDTHLPTAILRITTALSAAQLPALGAPSGLYFRWDETSQTSDMAVAIPTTPHNQIPGLTSINLPAGKALLVEYYGDYAGSAQAHYAIDAYLAQHKLTPQIPIIEEYITGPGQEPDTAKWLTRIIYPLVQ